MTPPRVDLDKLRVRLHRMSRGDLLAVAERAIEIVPRQKLRALVGDLVVLDGVTQVQPGVAPLLADVKKFQEASLRGQYYESFNVNSRNFMDKSKGTEEFIAEFNRLIGKCIRAAPKPKSPRPVREAFELLFELLRRIDEDRDSIVFFADEAGSWQVGVDYCEALPAYFQCLAATASGEEFAHEVDRTIADFADEKRPKHMAAARRLADSEQKAALRRLPAREKRR
jgi:hypothetical protein